MSEGYTLAHQLIINGQMGLLDFRTYKSYHRLIYYPDWFNKEFEDYKAQLIDMAKKSKPLKCTDTFKLQAGYPHEIDSLQKERLLANGIKRDYFSEGQKVTIPKIDIQGFIELAKNNTNPFIFTTPSTSNYIRDITVVDVKSHKKLAFVYVINRKAQVLCAWAEPKKHNKFSLKLPKNIIKKHNYQTE
jgi:hypothetical protein